MQVAPYLNCGFFNRPIEKAGDIATAFESFLEHLKANEAPNYWDVHWTPQATLLRPDLIRYSKLVKIENAKELSAALSGWLGPQIVDPFTTRRANESLIPYLPELVTARSSELIRSLYAKDFETFGYSEQPPEAKEIFSAEQFKLALTAVEIIRGRHQRLGEMSGEIDNLTQVVAERDGQIDNLTQVVAERDGVIASQEAQVASLIVERDSILNSKTWKITKPLRVVYPLLVTRPYRRIRHFGLAIVRNVINFMPIPERHKHLLRTRLFHYFEVIKGRRQLRTAPPYSAQEWLLVESAAGQEPLHLVASPYTAETMAMGSTHRFLLVSHQFSRTGAPRAVLFLARALFQLHGVRPVVISPADGPMREEFEQEGFPTVVDPHLFSYESYSFAACNFVMGFERVVVTSLASYPFIRYFRDIAKHLSWWIHETEAGFTAVAAMTSDLALLFAASESIWLGSPLCIPFASQYASREKLSLLLYGCEDAALPPRAPENGKVVFSVVGSLEPRKGQDIFLEAIARLPEDIRQKGIFRIIGSPLSYVSQRYCEKVRSGAALFREVECVPDVSPDRLQELYAETTVIVSASRDDPMPIVVTQGFMFSKVCLCSSAIGHAQLFEDGKEGLIFANESVEMLAEKMAWIISNPTESKAMGRAGRSVYEKFFDLNSFVQNVQKATAPDLS